MSDDGQQPKARALEKMVRQSSAAHERSTFLDPVFESLALGMSSGIRRLLGDEAEVSWEASTMARFGECCDALDANRVLGIFRLVECGGQGLIAVDAGLVDIAVEGLLGGGRVAGATPQPRPHTVLDRAIASRFIRLAIDELARAFVRTDQSLGPLTAKLVKLESNPRLLTLARRDEMIVNASFKVTLGSSEGGGRYDLLLPSSAFEPARRKRPSPASPSQHPIDQPASGPMLAALPEAPITLHAVVDRMTLTLADIAQWQEGTLLPLGVDAEQPTVLYGEHEGGRHIGRRMFVGRLGISQGRKAVRILEIVPETAGKLRQEAQP